MSQKSNQNDSLVERVFGFIRQRDLVSGEKLLLVGVSGGPDSVCLLHLLVKLKERLGIGLHVAHLNHMLRGMESEADARYVSEIAERLGIGVTLEQRDVKSYQSEHCLSLEEAAREVRYQFFAEVAGSMGTDRIALGHTADDQAETILMRLVRGSGVYGLQGMQPLTQWESLADTRMTVVRPLLEVSRGEVEIYCQQHDLKPRRDSSNLSSSYFRNRIRNELMPLLQSYNPRINEALLRTAGSLTVDFSFLEQQVSQIWDKAVKEEGETIILNSKELIPLHPALQRYLLREAVRRLLGNLKDIEWRHIESMVAALSMRAGKRLNLPRGLTFYVEREEFRITKD
jgi:tRNA(Ile)-lysidine synthase